LIFGSGYVVPPVIDFFSKNSTVSLVVGTNEPDLARKTLSKYGNPTIVGVDVTKDPILVGKLIESSDVVISLINANLHVPLAELCIKHGKPLVTASYISDEMERLNDSAVKAGVLLLNEIGLDPGLDHLTAMELIDECKSRGEVIESFVSWCGGLPAPQSISSDNPLKYKFSWSPRGVLLAAQNAAQYMKDGQIVKISGEDLLRQQQSLSDLHPIMQFEGIPNRNSMKYVELYGLDRNTIKTMFRGTLRYKVNAIIF
jgi:alpha-aminoadipic semialdehyde synthase